MSNSNGSNGAAENGALATLVEPTARQVASQLKHLQEFFVPASVFATSSLVPQQGAARVLQAFGMRNEENLPPEALNLFGVSTVPTSKVGIGACMFPKELGEGHFGIVPAHWLAEMAAQIGTAFMRSVQACATMIPIFSKENMFDTFEPVVPGQPVLGFIYVESLGVNMEGILTGIAHCVLTVYEMPVFRTRISFAMIPDGPDGIEKLARVARIHENRRKKAGRLSRMEDYFPASLIIEDESSGEKASAEPLPAAIVV